MKNELIEKLNDLERVMEQLEQSRKLLIKHRLDEADDLDTLSEIINNKHAEIIETEGPIVEVGNLHWGQS